MDEEIAIRCEGIKKHYGTDENRIEALKGIDLDIFMGKLTMLVGPSGSGKTTLLSIITNILTPDSGKLFLLGQEIRKMSEQLRADFCRSNLGIVFQSLFLIPTLTVAENVSLPLLVAGLGEEEALEKSMEILERVHLAHRANVSPATLSKGQQQRVAIARAMVKEAKIIVCDEPTSALDQAAGLEIMGILHGLAAHAKKSILVVTHDHRIFSFADRIVEINDGQIVKGSDHE